MQTARGQQASAVDLTQSHTEGFYYGLGIGLAAGISGTFWMGVLALASPAMNAAPTFTTLAVTGLSVACAACAALLALRRAN